MEPPKNVLPFRQVGEPKSPALTPVENSAFNEFARQLSARLERDDDSTPATPPPTPKPRRASTGSAARRNRRAEQREPPSDDAPQWLQRPEPPRARREPARPRAARPAADRHSDLPARPPALCQSGVSQAHGLSGPAGAGRGRRTRRALCRSRRLAGQQHLGGRNPGDDLGDAAFGRARSSRPKRACSRFHGTAIPRSR